MKLSSRPSDEVAQNRDLASNQIASESAVALGPGSSLGSVRDDSQKDLSRRPGTYRDHGGA